MEIIRNFSIIAHIDHGKSTLSDRLIQMCGSLNQREMVEQVLDSMDLERERGITIKSHSVSLNYKALDGKIYQLNCIDTPGHIDFSYEVSRSLAACEGALLIVDAQQGIEAQTLVNYSIAMEMGLKIIPVINKIDLLTADPERVSNEIKNIFGINVCDIVFCSAKTGFGIKNVLERLIHDIPPPNGNPNASLQALIIDSWFDNYFGVVSLVRIKNGTLCKGDKIKVMSTGQLYIVEKLGIFTPKRIVREVLNCNEVGWLICSIKDIYGAPVGDTLTLAKKPSDKALKGFKKIRPQVYAGLFPINSDDYKNFRDALFKLSLNDSSLFFEPENSSTLGFGFRCGFLGLLHMDIIKERLEREYNLELIITAPTVIYEVLKNNQTIVYVDTPSKLPSIDSIIEIREPIAKCCILSPQIYLGKIITLCVEKRGVYNNIIYHNKYVELIYEIPMTEIVVNFFDQLKSISRGYASLNYEFKFFKKSKMVRIDIIINGEYIEALTLIAYCDYALSYGRNFIDKLKTIIPRQQFDIVIQAAINNRIIARSAIKQLRKNVLAKCYGGDVTRKKKLLEKQKKGKKRMKQIGNVKLPQEAFLTLFQVKSFNTNKFKEFK